MKAANPPGVTEPTGLICGSSAAWFSALDACGATCSTSDDRAHRHPPLDSIHQQQRTVNPISPDWTTHDPADPPPVRPAEPDAADCCGEGCVRCIYDIHDEKLERYRVALAQWRARQA